MHTQMCNSTFGRVMLEQHLARLTHRITKYFSESTASKSKLKFCHTKLLLLVICLPTTVPRFRPSIILVSRLFLLILFIVTILQTELAQVVYKPKQYLK